MIDLAQADSTLYQQARKPKETPKFNAAIKELRNMTAEQFNQWLKGV